MPERSLLVLFGSQTGCAEDVAARVAREGRRRRLRVTLCAMDSLALDRLPDEGVAVFVCSTTGQGDEPENMRRFWRFLLRKSLPRDALASLSFAVFGLGDSSYQRFNYPAKKLHKRLIQLGASPLVPRGDGDDQHPLGLDGALDPWLEALWAKVDAMYPIPAGMQIIPRDVIPEPSFNVDILLPDDRNDKAVNDDDDDDDSNSNYASVKSNVRMTPLDHFQDVRSIVMDISDSALTYSPGDVAILTPRNLPAEVQLVIDHFGWADVADRRMNITSNAPGEIDLPAALKRQPTLRELLESYFDIFGRPRRYFFELLSFFATDPLHKDKLREFASAAGQDELYAYCHRPRRTTFEVLADFQSVRIPLKYLFDLIPPIRPRSYSISSSPSLAPASVELTVAVIDYAAARMKSRRRGVCTKWLASLELGARVKISIGRGTLSLPRSLDVPLICIAAGTGIAPMRSLLNEWIRSGATGETMLFFGSRNAAADYLYGREWEVLERRGRMRVITAFSRDQEDKVYVHHRMREHGRVIWDCVGARGGFVMLSGSAQRMPRDVTDCLKEIFQEHGGMSAEEAERYFLEMERTHRYQSECWS